MDIRKINTAQSHFPLRGICCALMLMSGLASSAVSSTAAPVQSLQTSQQAKNVTVKGQVVDEKGEPIIGATVVVIGVQGKGASTDLDGNFTIKDLEVGSKLKVSFVGMVNQTVTVSGSGPLKIVMKEDNKLLDEVVIVGYGSSTKHDLISSVSTIKTSEIVNIPVTNIGQGLAGRSPGLIVRASGGGINSKPAISIRGGGAPIYVIDGVIRSSEDFLNLQPEDIASVSILKDASATAVYGARATNGIIQVATKQGQSGKATISYDYNVSFSQPNIWPEQLPIWDQAYYANLAHKNDGRDPIYTDEAIAKFKDGSDPEHFANTDWRHAVLNDWATQQKHSVRLTGGSERTTYYLSLGHIKQNSMYKSGTNWMQRFNFRSSVSTYLKNIDLQVNATLDGYRQINHHPFSSKLGAYGQTFSWINNISPALPAYNKHGMPYNLKENPVADTSADAGNWHNIDNVINGKGELIWGVPFIKGLKARLSSSYRLYAETSKNWRKDPAQYEWDSKVPIYAEKPSLEHKASTGYSFTNQAFLDYNNQFGKNSVSALFGFEQSYTKGESYSAKREHYAFDIPQLGVGDANSQTNGGYEFEQGRAGFIGVLKYNYDNKYYAEASMRHDGSDNFAPGKRWGTFFSGSLGWIVTEEKFMSTLVEKNILNLLKMRASYGETGIDSVDRWAYLTSYNLNPQGYVIDGKFAPSFSEGALPSPDLTWYTTKQTDFGFDFASLANRLYGSFDYFYYSTKGYLIAPTGESYLNNAIGVSLPKVKSDSELRRGGIELQLGWRDNIGDFTYDVSGNFTYYNSIWALNEAESEVAEMNPYHRGQQVDSNYYGLLHHNLGYYTSADDIINSVTDPGTIKTGYLTAGDLKYRDTNGDGQITSDDTRRVGNPSTPHGQFGISINLGYKGFFFSTLFQGSTSFDMYIPGSAAMQTGQASDRALRFEYQKNFWRLDNQNAQYPRLMSSTTLNGNSNYLGSDFWLVNGAYLRMKDFQFGYDFKHSLLKDINQLSKVKLSLSGQNIFTISKAVKYGLDPEASSKEGYGYPVERIFAINLNIGF